jgi:hypothetical protein
MKQESTEPTPFERRTREVLEESTAKLDGRTLSRLTQARHRALARQDKPARQWWRAWMPAGAVTAAALLAVMVWTRPGVESGAPVTALSNGSSAFEDIDLLADGDAPDFVTEAGDVDFYEWAAGEIES